MLKVTKERNSIKISCNAIFNTSEKEELLYFIKTLSFLIPSYYKPITNFSQLVKKYCNINDVKYQRALSVIEKAEKGINIIIRTKEGELSLQNENINISYLDSNLNLISKDVPSDTLYQKGKYILKKYKELALIFNFSEKERTLMVNNISKENNKVIIVGDF